MYKSATTIDDIFRLVLPSNSKLLAGSELLTRTVSWACSLRPSPPAFPKLDGNEIALIDMEDLRRLDGQMRLDRVILSLQNARIAAVAVLGSVDSVAIKAAISASVALFQLPASAQITSIERAIIRLIVDRTGYLAQRSAELQRSLNQITLDNGGVERIAEQIYQFAQQPILLLREDGQISAAVGTTLPADSHILSEQLPNLLQLRSWVATHAPDQLHNAIGILQIAQQSAAAFRPQVVVSPIVTGDTLRGYCLLMRNGSQAGGEINAVEEIAVVQGAAAAAMEWAKQNAVGVAEERMRAAFVDELLASEVADEQAWIQRGTSMGFDLSKPHVAWFVEARNIANWPAPLLQFISERAPHLPYTRREEGFLLFWPTENPQSGRDLKLVAEELVRHLQHSHPKARIVVGISRPAVRPTQWLQSMQQARESWRLGKEWKGAAVTYFGDLGLYQLLTSLGPNPEAARFYRKTLSKLLAYDIEKNAELVTTLEGFFACHGNLSQAASKLHIHRNTLTYRLEQIASIAQVDLEDPDARFSLQLALKLRPVMKA